MSRKSFVCLRQSIWSLAKRNQTKHKIKCGFVHNNSQRDQTCLSDGCLRVTVFVAGKSLSVDPKANKLLVWSSPQFPSSSILSTADQEQINHLDCFLFFLSDAIHHHLIGTFAARAQELGANESDRGNRGLISKGT
ncbi:hypothetical protein BpHYR1_040284 [Brachionus plicatilis]|uniref:Uncharacterized protein n=1 Tax=Brachionus plicatilis TaxID=10195 RepID=A0A3M7R915_BRAPC|nr:hypothetical protein BpHYR1_040284 [Brachionus plicatilis]